MTQFIACLKDYKDGLNHLLTSYLYLGSHRFSMVTCTHIQLVPNPEGDTLVHYLVLGKPLGSKFGERRIEAWP